VSVAGSRVAASDTIEFAGFRLHRREGAFRLDASGKPIPIAIGSRALELFWALACRPGDLLSKRQLMEAVWPDTTVEDKNLAMQVSTLRQVLEREGGKGAWIQTVPGRGYRFVAPMAEAQGAVSPLSADVISAPATRRNWTVSAALAALALLAFGGLLLGGVGWMGAGPKPPLAYSPQDRRQSNIVIPFENASANPAQDDIASNVTREVTDIFAQSPSVPSIPTAVAATYRGKPIDLRRIGSEHDVHFALLGNSRQQDGRLIVSVTLYETTHGNQVWAQRFEQAEGAETGSWIVASLIHQHVDQATMDEEARIAQRDHPRQLDKRDLMFAAYASDMLQISKAAIEAQIALIDRALALDPNYVWALRAKGRRHADLVIHGFSDDPTRDVAIAAEAVDRALELAPNSYTTLKEKTYVLRAQGNWPEAEALTRRLLELRPRVSARHSNLGSILMAEGRNAEALDSLLASKRLQIATDDIPVVDANIAATLLATGRLREAIDQARLATPEFTPANGRIAELPWLVLIAAESASGGAAEARADLNRFLAVSRSWKTIAAIQDVPFLAGNAALLDGLRDAGMPLR
jgi:DNA-binding winged helix-turn-helix (wHTH) protein/TolB-like protein